jgi:hypothetical protein
MVIPTDDTLSKVELGDGESPLKEDLQASQNGEQELCESTTIEPKVREVLLEDARTRFKAEQERYGQAFSRSGIYLGIVAVYANALVRFHDKPPQMSWSLTSALFYFATLVLVGAVVIAGVCIVRTLLPREVGQATRPSEWLSYRSELHRAFLKSPNEPLTTEDSELLDDALSDTIKTKMLANLAEAIDANAAINEERSRTLYRASLAIQGGLFALIVATSLYVWLGLAPSQGHKGHIDTVSGGSQTRDASVHNVDQEHHASPAGGPSHQYIEHADSQAGNHIELPTSHGDTGGS